MARAVAQLFVVDVPRKSRRTQSNEAELKRLFRQRQRLVIQLAETDAKIARAARRYADARGLTFVRVESLRREFGE
jgi:ribosomal protein L4